MNKKIITRFAPSPTGALHIGGVRTALYNYLFAKKNGGEFHLRIEDTDKEREVEGATKYITDSLEWFGIKHDGDIVTQSTRLETYKMFAMWLVVKEKAYVAFDTKEELTDLRGTDPNKPIGYTMFTRDRMRNSLTLSHEESESLLYGGTPYVIRFKTERNKEINFKDIIRGEINFKTNNLDDKVLFKSDGYPTYHLANVVDDHELGTTHVIRGDEWLSSTPLHVMLYDAFGWDIPEYAHLPLILGEDGKKLSKRHGDKYGYPVFPMNWTYTSEGKEISVTGFKDNGYEPEALLNFMVLLGWTPKGDTDIISIEEMIEKFDLNDVHVADAMFGIAKLKFLNKEYLKNKPVDYLVPKILSKVENVYKYVYPNERLRLIVEVALERSNFAHEMYDSVDYFFKDVNYDNVKVKSSITFSDFGGRFVELIDALPEWTKESIDEPLYRAAIGASTEKSKILPDLRNALCGGKSGTDLTTTMFILGKEETKKRIMYYRLFLSLSKIPA